MSPTWSERVAATRPVSPANLLCFHAWQFERAALQHIAVPLSLLVGCVLLALTSESAEQARMCVTDACGALVGVLVRLRLRAHPDQERAQVIAKRLALVAFLAEAARTEGPTADLAFAPGADLVRLECFHRFVKCLISVGLVAPTYVGVYTWEFFVMNMALVLGAVPLFTKYGLPYARVWAYTHSTALLVAASIHRMNSQLYAAERSVAKLVCEQERLLSSLRESNERREYEIRLMRSYSDNDLPTDAPLEFVSAIRRTGSSSISLGGGVSEPGSPLGAEMPLGADAASLARSRDGLPRVASQTSSQPAEDAPAWILGDALDRLSDAATGSTDGGMSHHTAKMGPEFSPLLNAHEKTA